LTAKNEAGTQEIEFGEHASLVTARSRLQPLISGFFADILLGALAG